MWDYSLVMRKKIMTYAQRIIHELSLMSQQAFVDIHIVLENAKIRKQLEVSEPVDDKIKNLRYILETEF